MVPGVPGSLVGGVSFHDQEDAMGDPSTATCAVLAPLAPQATSQ
jgi:hypothetical protein